MDDKPKIRLIDAFPVDIEGQRLICLSDPQRVSNENIFINDLAFFFVTMMNGSNTIADLQANFSRRYGDIIPCAQIGDLVRRLDDHFFLDNDRYRNRIAELRSEYEARDTRPCSHAGLSYPADPAELRSVMDGFYSGLPAPEPGPGGPVRGIMAPHIDIRHGGPCFAAAFSHLRGRRPDVFVILGIGHAASENIFTVVPRSFETPLGRAPLDAEGAEKIGARLGSKVFAEDFVHRNEHSIEFQVVFLQHLWADAEPVPVLPVLCTSFYEMETAGIEPVEDARVKEFLEALEEAVGDRDACYIAGVDLAHVGLKFGDPAPPDDAALERIRRADIELLGHAENVDASAFFRDISKDHNARNICGAPAMYTFLKMSGASRGRLLKYDQLVDTTSGSVVSYASLVFD